ncbi:MAG: (2Fe-2S) ferredoxin domain-containing protein [Deltaproteobacteria bacterium]|nr:MAG: (2Fe-2S) ferredoxin domain-containing protein [Deltaproteobacteria bacterium]
MPRQPWTRHIFICTNERPPGHPRGSCAARGSEALVPAFKQALKARGLDRTVRAQRAGCFDYCEGGCVVVIYPEGVWYGGVTPEDVEEIVAALETGRTVERLKLDFEALPDKG